MKKSKKILILILAITVVVSAVIVAICCLNNSDNNSNIKLTIDQKDFDTIKSKTSLSGTIETSDTVEEIIYEGYKNGDVRWSGKGVVNKNKWYIKEVFLCSGENEIVITAKTDKGSVSKTIDVYYDTGTSYKFDESKVRYDEETGITYVNNILLVIFENDDITEDEILEIMKPYNGEIAGRSRSIWDIRIDEKSYSELKEISDELEEKDEVFAAMIDTVSNFVPSTDIRESNVAYKYWEDTGDWGYEAMEVSSVYDYENRFSEIEIGVVDTGFDLDHEDLNGIFTPSTENMESENDYKEWNEKQKKEITNSHGTHVAGIIGAIADKKGITGILKKVKIIYSDWLPNETKGKQEWDTDSRILKSLEDSVQEGAKVVNFSLGASGAIEIDNNGFVSVYSSERGSINFSQTWKDEQAEKACEVMENLLNDNYDFVVVQSSGNGTPVEVAQNEKEIIAVDATNNGCWCSVTENNVVASTEKMKHDILNRIIVVGNAKKNSDGTYQQAIDSNGGTRVDICAPGTDIYSTTVDNNYGLLSGTSMAAPQVTGVCGLVWSVNSNFTGAEVKEMVCNYTSITVNDNPDGKHPLNDTYKMVNAKLAVEEAIRRTDVGYGTITAFVKEKDTDKPLNNITVTVDVNGAKRTIITDKTGKLELTLPVGTYTLTLSSDNFVTKTVKTVIEKDVENVNLNTVYMSPKMGNVIGTVKDISTGKAISGVTVEVIDNESDNLTPITTVTTDSNGLFSVKLPYGSYSLSFNHNNYEYYGMTVNVDTENVVLNKPVLLTPKNSSGGGNDDNRTVIDSGSCGADGDNVKWVLYDDGELAISGNGNMKNYDERTKTPWFNNISKIKFINIDGEITSISKYAFNNCVYLTKVTIPNSVVNIGYFAFLGCFNLTDITLPNNLKNIGDFAFNSCKNLTNINLPKNITNIGNHAFGFCTGLTDINLPSNITNIGSGAFHNCSSLETVSIPESVINIGYCVFENCHSLIKITVNSNNLYYSSDSHGVLYNKSKTKLIQYPIGNTRKSYSIPNGVNTICDNAFRCCNNLVNVIIPDSVVNIGSNVFGLCKRLTNITVDCNNLYYSSDSYGVLYDKSKTKLIQYPIGNTRKSYVIPDDVTSIYYNSFTLCENLESITIPKSVSYIDGSAFGLCANLTNVYYSGTKNQWNNITIDTDNLDLLNATIHYNS